jgi:hypothetical protein
VLYVAGIGLVVLALSQLLPSLARSPRDTR